MHSLSALLTVAVVTAGSTSPKGTADRAYTEAQRGFFALKHSAARQRLRSSWLRVISDFARVAADGSAPEVAARARYTAAELWSDLARLSGRRDDTDQALASYAAVVAEYRTSALADDALWGQAEILLRRRHDRRGAQQLLRQLLSDYPSADMAPRARALIARLEAMALSAPEEPPPAPRSGTGQTKLLVVLDPGHGGADSGAVGPGGVREKDVVLAITANVAARLRAAGVEVALTRSSDTYVPLEQRTALANRARADVFVSIHANSHRNRTAHGTATYYLDASADRYAVRLAAVENRVSEKQIGDLQLILADLATKANTRHSATLARGLQQRLLTELRPLDAQAKDLGARAALFYVLLGARMPAVLVETAFVSNPREAKFLSTRAYQDAVARALVRAVLDHLGAPLEVANVERALD